MIENLGCCRIHRRLGSTPAPVARLGIISDTHGLLRPQAVEFLQGCDRILHAGDIGNAEILAQLSSIAPVTAIRGNNDTGAWAEAIAHTELFEFNGIHVYAIHDLSQLDIEPIAAGIHVVVSGHSHKPLIERRDGIFFVNPGSAGPRRFKVPISVADIVIEGSAISPRIAELDIDRAARA
jgi:putative phosphoesterase